MSSAVPSPDRLLTATDVSVSFGDVDVLDGADIFLDRGEILGVVGGSGTGKSVFMRTILGLVEHRRGDISFFGRNYDRASASERVDIDRRIGVLFQHGALFSSLTVRENIQVPMREYLDLPSSLLDELASVKLRLVGLSDSAGDKYPSQLSGGMTKRAGLARALSLDPELVFLDEPTSGLDPIGAEEIDELILSLRDNLGLTVFMITHDLDSLSSVCDRVSVLRYKRVLVSGGLAEVCEYDDSWVKSYFLGKRGRLFRTD